MGLAKPRTREIIIVTSLCERTLIDRIVLIVQHIANMSEGSKRQECASCQTAGEYDGQPPCHLGKSGSQVFPHPDIDVSDLPQMLTMLTSIDSSIDKALTHTSQAMRKQASPTQLPKGNDY